MGLFKQAETYANLKAASELEKIRKQGERNKPAPRPQRKQRPAPASKSEAAPVVDERVAWCVDRIIRLENEVAQLRRELDESRRGA